MIKNLEPLLHPVEIERLRPTQMTVGRGETARKRAEWREHAALDGPDFLGRHMIPAVIGPKQVRYLVDHHHLVRALYEEGVSHVLVSIVADLSVLKKQAFWTFMDNRGWLHPYDAKGRRRTYDRIPRRIGELSDDPYRSLSGALRRAGGYAKTTTPYSEFLWADFLRHRIETRLVERAFEEALGMAVNLAHQVEADYLPGWCGRSRI